MDYDDFKAGAKSVMPILIGVVPFALITGISAVKAGIVPLQAIMMSSIIFAGAAQLAAIELIQKTAPLSVIVVTAIFINLRFSMYSASLSPHFRKFSSPWKAFCAYVLTDQAYAVSINEYQSGSSRDKKWFYLGAAVTLWFVWQIGTIAGVLVGYRIPSETTFEFAVPLTFMALLFPTLKDMRTRFVGIVSGVTAVVAMSLPLSLGTVTAAIVGILSGVVIDSFVSSNSWKILANRRYKSDRL